MSVTQLSTANIQAMAQDIWAPLFSKELREKTLLAGLVNKDYEGEIKKLNDTVKVSQINAPQGQLLTAQVDADSFTPEALSSTTIDIVADKRAVGSFEFEDLIAIQTQLGKQESEIRDSLMFAVRTQVNDFLYSLVAPVAGNDIVTTDFNAGELSKGRRLAGQNKWLKNKTWWALLDPQYHQDLLDSTTITSSDHVTNRPVMSGDIGKRFGFEIMEDDSRAVDFGLLFHPDFLHLVTQTEPTFKVSDLHSNKKFGFVISVDMIFGARLGIDGDKKHIRYLPA